MRRLFERGLAAEAVRGLLCNKHCLRCLLLLDMGCLRWATERGTSEIAKASAVSVFVKGDRTNLPLLLAAAGLDIVMTEYDA